MDAQTMMLLKDGLKTVDSVEEALRETDIRVKSGYTKIVLIDKDCDFVYKFQKVDNVRYNYCEREARIYQMAVKWGIAFLFAPTIKVGYIDKKLPYYQQTKVESFGYCFDKTYNHPALRKRLKRILDKYRPRERRRGSDCPTEWLAYVLKTYGDVVTIKLLQFISLYKINDLRDENVGFKDNKPILVDYSGFHGGGRDRW